LCLNLGLSTGRLGDVGGHGEPPRCLINGKCSNLLKRCKAIHAAWLTAACKLTSLRIKASSKA
jgi:hypothetical protein